MNQTRTRAILFVVLISVALSGCRKQPVTGNGGWTIGDNQRARLADYKGKVVVLDFYATWCEPCRAEIPHLLDLKRRYADKGLVVIGLNVGGEDDHDKVPAFAKELSIDYPLAFPDDDLVDKFLSDNQNIPQAFVFDRDGKQVKRFIGYGRSSGTELERVVGETVEGRASRTSAGNTNPAVAQ